MHARLSICFLSAFTLLSVALMPAAAQDVPVDTSRVIELDPVVVTADRTAQALGAATASVSIIRADALRPLPVATLAEALQTVPGFTFLSLDGLGYDPQAVVRGFYGGGEAEYVVLLLNGRPLNGFTRGLINWNLVALDQVESVEVVRGGASSLYGDAAIGGVVNVITDPFGGSPVEAMVRGGAYGTYEGGLRLTNAQGPRRFSVYGNVSRTAGFRDDTDRQYTTFGGAAELLRKRGGTLSVNALYQRQWYDVPGPLADSLLDADRSTVEPFYRFDWRDETLQQLGLDGTLILTSSATLTGSLTGERRQNEATATLALAPGFADTQARAFDTNRFLTTVQLRLDPLPLPIESRLTVGADASAGAFDTEYFGVLIGGVETYENAPSGEPGDSRGRGDGERNAGALYAQLDVYPISPLRFSLGGRFDAVSDTFTPEGEEDITSSHTAFSPKAGVNLRYIGSAANVGSIYANVGRSFKTPTLDQLYDQRLIPFGEFAVSLSNPELEPQHGVSYEVGLYHRSELIPQRLGGNLSVSLYQMDMTNELDFSLETLSYVNIGQSRHRGVEAGLNLAATRLGAFFFNYTNQTVTLEYGDFEGNFVKAIPRDVITAGLTAYLSPNFEAGLKINSARRIFLDDANTIRLPNYATLDAKLSFTRAPVTAFVSVQNVLDEAYSTTGFPDPSGLSDIVYYYPAAGRRASLGLRLSL